ncbi:MAG: hypothetical protein V4613_14815 [Bacteroidota bacterium]
MKFFALIILSLISFNLIGSPTKDTLIISKDHLLFDRDYGLGLKYNHNYVSANKNNYGIGYYWGSKRWDENIYEIYLNYDLVKATQLSVSYTKTNNRVFEGTCFGLDLNLHYNESATFSFAPKAGFNVGILEITSYCIFLPLDNFRYQNFGLSITFRPQILRNFTRKGQSFSNPYLQYELNQRRKAQRQGKTFIVK